MKISRFSIRIPGIMLILILMFLFILVSCDNSWNEDNNEYDNYDDSYYEDSNNDSNNEDNSDSSNDVEEPIIVASGGEHNPPYGRDFKFTLPIFSPDSPWNQRADDAAVLPESDKQILVTYRVLLGDISDLEGYDEPATDWPYMDISLYEYTVPIFLAGEETQSVYICEDDGIQGWANPKFNIDTEGGPVTVPAPAGTIRPGGPEDSDADAWLVLYDPETHIAWDYYRAMLEPNEEECEGFVGGMIGDWILEAGEVDFFDVRDLGVRTDSYSSARAHGTPLLAGLIIPEDIESGAISHALALAIPGPRNLSNDPYEPLRSDYFSPASTTEADFYNTNPYALAAGQRVRLTQILYDEDGEVIDESELAPITQMFLMSLRNYGAYLVDNSGGFTFYAEDIYTASLDLSDDEINFLIGEPPGTPLPEGLTKWQIVIDQLGNDLEIIPIAVSPGDYEPDPETAEIQFANFEVVEPATKP